MVDSASGSINIRRINISEKPDVKDFVLGCILVLILSGSSPLSRRYLLF
nr:MAG TPA: hypothetical protein [Caudoviricetes sp.]